MRRPGRANMARSEKKTRFPDRLTTDVSYRRVLTTARCPFPKRDDRSMSRANMAGSLALVVCWAGLAFAQDPPPLEAPGSEPEPPKATATQPAAPAATPASPASKTARPKPPFTTSPAAPANSRSSPGSQVRPLLVIPGVTGPSNSPGVTSKRAIPQPPRLPNTSAIDRRENSSVLSAPPQGRSPFREDQGQPNARPGQDLLDEPIPMSIEPLDDLRGSGADTKSSTRPGSTLDRSRGASSRIPPASGSGGSTEDRPPGSARPRPSPRLVPGMLGRFFQPPPAQNRNRAEPKTSAEKARAKPETDSEPVTDASVKRKIEKQIRETLGDRVRSVEVRVSGRNVLIVARTTRFWQKRNVRRSLETLPVLQGYHARINLED